MEVPFSKTNENVNPLGPTAGRNPETVHQNLAQAQQNAPLQSEDVPLNSDALSRVPPAT